MADARTFVCTVEPHGNGGWTVWISEDRYRGVDTDAALGRWDRLRSGAMWSSGRLVGTRRTEWGARRLARRAVRIAEREAARHQRQNEQWRANYARESFTVTKGDGRG